MLPSTNAAGGDQMQEAEVSTSVQPSDFAAALSVMSFCPSVREFMFEAFIKRRRVVVKPDDQAVRPCQAEYRRAARRSRGCRKANPRPLKRAVVAVRFQGRGVGGTVVDLARSACARNQWALPADAATARRWRIQLRELHGNSASAGRRCWVC
jgi:hypothetical protein